MRVRHRTQNKLRHRIPPCSAGGKTKTKEKQKTKKSKRKAKREKEIEILNAAALRVQDNVEVKPNDDLVEEADTSSKKRKSKEKREKEKEILYAAPLSDKSQAEEKPNDVMVDKESIRIELEPATMVLDDDLDYINDSQGMGLVGG